MKKGNHKLFIDKEKLYRMVNLRLNGWSFTSLAVHFDCDRDSIEQQCKKYDIGPATKDVFTIERIISQVLPKEDISRWLDLGDHRVCRGRDYKDYPHSKSTLNNIY